ILLNCLIEGLREAGAEVEVVKLREKKIRNCIGCFTCWTKTPGKCLHKDDMTLELFPKFLACDLVIYASPLYYHTINASMAAFMERTLPAATPFFEQGEDGKTYHPLRYKLPASVLLSVCGFPEASEFDAMLEFFKRTRHQDARPVAAICRAGASLLSAPPLAAKTKDVLDATRQAGRELVANLQITPETMARITQSFGDAKAFGKMGNIYWNTCIAAGVTPKEFDEKKMMLRPQTLEDFMFMFPYGINARAAGDQTTQMQFNFSGDVQNSCYFTVENGRVDARQGKCENPALTIDTPFHLWMDIMSGKADGRQMFMERKYQVQGDLTLMMKLFQKQPG
ncbi:MAG TPA: SCP2 sterol-binding domain-containing protein, partial [Smithellaceae bacterium]|nr:SCP2 sterol-binding domain-containing protein [Smithellaceae bacterium]